MNKLYCLSKLNLQFVTYSLSHQGGSLSIAPVLLAVSIITDTDSQDIYNVEFAFFFRRCVDHG